MIDVKVIASGSSGNCTALTSGDTTILLDVGIKFKTIQQALNFKNPTAALITHEHGDHAYKSTINELLKRGVDIYATIGTLEALDLPERHNLHGIELDEVYEIGECFMSAIPAHHDAADPASFFVCDCDLDRAAYVVDTGCIDKGLIEQCDGITKLLIETNYSKPLLRAATTEARLKERIRQNHLSVEQVADFLAKSSPNLWALKEIWLMHVSKKHGNGIHFKRIIKSALPWVKVRLGAAPN